MKNFLFFFLIFISFFSCQKEEERVAINSADRPIYPVYSFEELKEYKDTILYDCYPATIPGWDRCLDCADPFWVCDSTLVEMQDYFTDIECDTAKVSFLAGFNLANFLEKGCSTCKEFENMGYFIEWRAWDYRCFEDNEIPGAPPVPASTDGQFITPWVPSCWNYGDTSWIDLSFAILRPQPIDSCLMDVQNTPYYFYCATDISGHSSFPLDTFDLRPNVPDTVLALATCCFFDQYYDMTVVYEINIYQCFENNIKGDLCGQIVLTICEDRFS